MFEHLKHQYEKANKRELKIEELLNQYKDEIALLAKHIWEQTPTAKNNPNVKVPEWFSETMLKRGHGFLSLAYSTPTTWVVFPEYADNFSMVVFKKSDDDTVLKKIEKLKTRYYNEPKDSKMANTIAKKTISSLNVKQITKQKNVIKIEDDNVIIFSFPTPTLQYVLVALGAPEEMIRLATSQYQTTG